MLHGYNTMDGQHNIKKGQAV